MKTKLKTYHFSTDCVAESNFGLRVHLEILSLGPIGSKPWRLEFNKNVGAITIFKRQEKTANTM